MEQTDKRDIRPLFWALIRIGFSVNIGFTGVLMIDILPAFYGYWQVSCVLDSFPDYDRPRALKPVLFLVALLSLIGWFPGIAAAIPAAVDTMLSLAAMACNTLIYYHVLGLLIFLSERAGRHDLAETAAGSAMCISFPTRCSRWWAFIRAAYRISGICCC